MKKENLSNEQLTAWEASLLFDIYGGLLTDKKRKVMELYHEENLSLSEIAEEQGISRAAVFDALKSAENNLREYEKKLGLMEDYRTRQELVEKLRHELSIKLGEDLDTKGIEEILNQLEK